MSNLTPEELDELASAYLDGEATAEERAMVEADPDLLARAEQFRHAAAEVASPVTEAGREEIIAQALEALKPADEKPDKLLTRLRYRYERLSLSRISLRDRLRNRRLVPIFSVAAVLVLVFLTISIVVLLADNTGEDDSEAVAPATTQAIEPEQLLESAEFQAAFDEVFASSAPSAAPTTAAVPTVSPAETADAPAAATTAAEAADETDNASAFAFAAPLAEDQASQDDLDPGGPPLELPEEPETATEIEADSSASDDFADVEAGASTRTGECPTGQELEEASEDDSEGDLEDDEEASPGDPDAIERSGPPPGADARPDTELEIPEPPDVTPSPPPGDSSSVSSNTIPSPDEDAPLLECP